MIKFGAIIKFTVVQFCPFWCLLIICQKWPVALFPMTFLCFSETSWTGPPRSTFLLAFWYSKYSFSNNLFLLKALQGFPSPQCQYFPHYPQKTVPKNISNLFIRMFLPLDANFILYYFSYSWKRITDKSKPWKEWVILARCSRVPV